MRAPRIRYRLNLRATLVLTALGLATAPALFFLWGYQEDRVLRIALKQVKAFQEASLQAKDRDAQGRTNDLALRHLNPYLEYRPDDPEALEIEAALLTARDDGGGAAKVYEHILRVEKAGWKAHQNARRRLAAYYIQYSDLYRSNWFAKVMPEETSKNLKYYNAEIRAEQLLAENAKAKPPVDDPEAHRLRAMALEGQIIPNNKKSRDGGVEVVVVGRKKKEEGKTLEEAAILEYQNALALDPGDVVAADRLAKFCQKAKKPNDARKVLDDLLKARPDVVEVRIVRYNYFRETGDTRAAADELAAANELDPENLGIILIGAENALQSDSRDTAEARRWLDKVPTESQNEPSVLLVRGMIEYSEKHHDTAISIWRTGLKRANGSDLGLTQRLALVLLELGRDNEAAKLVAQYQRLAGDQDPVFRFLEAIQDEHASRFSPAIEGLRWARDRLPEGYQETLHLALGRCYEKQGEWDEAEKSYRTALQRKPKSVALRQSLARLLLEKRPEDAVRELAQGLIANPNQPDLLLTLYQAKLQEQKSRRPERRNWTEFEAVYNQARAAAPQSVALDLLHAEELVAKAQLDHKLDQEAIAFLTKAVEKAPESAELAIKLAECLQSQGQSEQALQVLREAVEKAPESAELAIKLAECLQRQGQPEQALQVLAKASDPKAAGDRGWLRIQRVLVMAALGQDPEAWDLLLRNVDQLPTADQNEIWRFLVLLCKNRGDQDTTRAAYNEWLQLLPDDPRPKLALLEMDIMAGDPKVIIDRLESLRPRDEQGKLDFTWSLAQARVLLWKLSLSDSPAETGGAKSKEPKSDRETLLKEADVLVEKVLHEIKIDPAALLIKGQILEKGNARERALDSYTQAWNRGNAEALLRLVDLLVDLNRREDLDRLRHSDTTKQLDQIVADAHLKKGQKEEAFRIVQQSLTEQPARQAWQVRILDALGENEKAESVLRALAEQSNRLDVWLVLVRYQADHRRTQAVTETVTETIAEIKRRLKVEWPELLEAECRWAASDFSAADKAFEEALKSYREVHDVQLVASRYFEDRGRHADAEACLRRILARNPNDRSIVRQLAVVLTAQADRPDAWKEARELLGPEGPTTNTPEERLTRAIVLARSGDEARSKRAIALLQALVADLLAGNTLRASARDMLIRLLLATGQADEASKEAAIAAAKGANPSAIVLYAEALLQSKQFGAAEGQQKRLEELDPTNVHVANLRTRVIVGRSKPGAAAAALEAAYLASEDDAGAEMFGREAFASILAMGPDASAVAERLGRHLAKHNLALSWMPALILMRRGERDEVLNLCQTSVEAGKSPVDLSEACKVVLGVAVASRSEAMALENAGKVLDAAVKRASETDDPLVMKAMISHLQRDFKEEVRLYRKVLEHQPRNTLVLNNLAYALSEGLDEPTAALETIDELLGLGYRSAEFLDTRGVVLMRLGQFDKAIKDLEEAVHSEHNGVHFFHLARAYQKAGREAEFRTALKQAQQAGLTPESMDPIEWAEFEKLRNL